MKRNILAALAIGALWVSTGGAARADTEWNTREYDLYGGDFDGDSRTDILYVAKDPSKASGIARSDGTGPNIPWQSWLSNYLGIPWHSNLYRVIVADFNGDLRSDVFLQRSTAGDHYLLLANENGKFASIHQTIGNYHLGYDWSQSAHKAHAGDFTADGYADLFLQGTSPGSAHLVMVTDANGQFSSGPRQWWTDASWGAFKWSTKHSNIFVGDFNGDRRSDLLVQPKPTITMIDFDVTIPVPTYAANSFGIALAQPLEQPFRQEGTQSWSRNHLGLDWSPTGGEIVVGDFDGNGTTDVLLQARHGGRASYLVSGNTTGEVFRSGSALAGNVTWSSSSYRLIVGNFDGTPGAGVYWQATSPGGVNYSSNSVTSVALTTHNPATPTGVVPASVAGHTVGSFAVSHSGAATYSIPIAVPPGVSGMQPDLSITYQSGAGNGLLGVGWSLSGFSEIARCGKTFTQDGTTAAVTLTTADRFCLDGNRLKLTAGHYGASGSTYRTELETFSYFTAVGTAGNGPAYFSVEAKNGLTYEYGSTADSRIEAATAWTATTTPHTWALNKVFDRHGNTMTISYYEDGAPNASHRPKEILYTSNTGAGLASAYKVVFVWAPRSTRDILTAYLANGVVKETMRLDRIETQYNEPGTGWRLVRKYQLSYNTSGSTPRTRLGAIQECDRNGACMSPTTITWQDGEKGWESTDIVAPGSASALMEYSHAIDIDGDGRDDLVYPQAVNGQLRWHYMRALVTGGFSGSTNTGIAAGDDTNGQYARAQVIDYFAEGRQGLLVEVPGYSVRQLMRWTGSGLALNNTSLGSALTGKEWIADFDGDGRADILYMTQSSGTGYIHVYKNLGASPGQQVAFGPGQLFYSTPTGGAFTPFAGDRTDSSSRVLDFNGDGRADIIYSMSYADCERQPCTYHTDWLLLTSTGSSFVHASTWSCMRAGSSCAVVPLVGDFNGDGLSDVLNQAYYPEGNWQIVFGGGTASSTVTLPADFNTSGFVEDYDRDGNADLFYAPSATSGSWYALRSTGTGFESPVAIPLSSSSANNSIRIFDIDGDGLRDLGFKNSDYRVRKHKGKAPDLMAGIADGFGNRVDITYAPLTDWNVYSRSNNLSTFPLMDVQAPMYVVKSYNATDGIGGTYTVTQRYSGLRAHLQGRGVLGFESRESTDSRTGIKSAWSFRQDHPYIGFISRSATYQPNGKLIAEMINSPSQLVMEEGSYEERRFPYTSFSQQFNYEVSSDPETDGVPLAKVVTQTALDDHGNTLSVTATTTDLSGVQQRTYSTAQVWTYADTNCAWRGFATKLEVTNTVPGYAAQTRTVSYEKDPNHAAACRIHKEIVEPNDSTVAVTTTFGYDAFGHANSHTVTANDIEPRVTTMSYGSQGVFPVSITQTVTSTFSQTSSKTYDYALGVPATATDPNGLQSSWKYDGFGRVTRETLPDNTKMELTYAACNVANGYCGDSRLRYRVTTQELDATDPGVVVRSSVQRFDAQGRPLYDETQTSSGAFSVVATNYDSLGRVSQRSRPYFPGLPVYFTTFSYDLLDRPTQEQRQVSEAVSGTQTIKYRYSGLTQYHEDANGKTTQKQLDAIGQVVGVVDAAGGYTSYEYDQFGNLRKTRDPAGNEIVSTFNIRGFRTSTSDPNMGNWTYGYYPTGELSRQVDAKNNIVRFTYDRLGRPKTRTEQEGVTTFVYGESAAAKNIGELESVSSTPNDFSKSFTYDNLGRLQDATTTIDAASYVVSNSYHPNTGLLETVTYPASTTAVPGGRFKVKYEYEYGQVKRVRDFNAPSTVYWENVATNAAGQIIDEVYGNGVRTYSEYDGITGLLGSRSAGASGQVQNLTYQWDKVGNLTQRRDARLDFTEAFGYDEINRLKTSTLNGVANLSLTYYANGNIRTKSDVGTYGYPTQGAGSVRPHAVTSAGGRSYEYDANGNMTLRDGTTITWYTYNKPNRITRGGSYSQFYYGPDRGRYKQVAHTSAGGSQPTGTETTIYVGELFEKVTKTTGVLEYKHYISAGNETIAVRTLRSGGGAADEIRYLHKDHLGSVDVITSESGAVVQRLSYDAFGKRRNAAAWGGTLAAGDWANIAAITHRGFTFHESLDHLDLIHMNGRVYDPDLGRFISADPFIQAPLMSQSLNRYSYVMNNPLSLVDPSGYSWLSKAWKSVKKFVKKYWREIVAIAVTVVSMGTLGPIAAGFWGAVATGATAGAIYGATVTALYGGNVGDILRGALTGAIAGGVTACLTYGMGQLFGGGYNAPTQPGVTEKPIDFGVKFLEQAASDTAKQIGTTGINAETIAAITAAYNSMSKAEQTRLNGQLTYTASQWINKIGDMEPDQFVKAFAFSPQDVRALSHTPGVAGARRDQMVADLQKLSLHGLNGLFGEGGQAALQMAATLVVEKGTGAVLGKVAEKTLKAGIKANDTAHAMQPGKLVFAGIQCGVSAPVEGCAPIFSISTGGP